MNDFTKMYDYKRLIKEEKNHFKGVELTNDLREGGAHASGAWNYYWSGVGKVLDKAGVSRFGEYLSKRFRGLSRPIKVLSLGSGYCGHELALARDLSIEYEIHCTDINMDLFDAAKKAAQAEQLNLTFSVEDLNFVKIKPRGFDVIFSHAAIHHALNFELLFDEIANGLAPEGIFHLVEVVGKNKKLIWDANEKFANSLLDLVPNHITRGLRLNIDEDPDGMEGLRQAELLGLLSERFEPEFEYQHGAFIRFICTNPQLTECFDPGNPERKRYLDFLIAADELAVKYGTLKPLEIWGIYRPRMSGLSIIP